MNRNTFWRFLLLAFAICGASEQQALSQSDPPKLFVEQMKKTVVYIAVQHPVSQQLTAVGTGFLMFMPEPRLGAGRGFNWLVTCKHVLKTQLPDGSPGPYFPEVWVRFNLREAVEPGGRQFDLSKVRVLDDGGKLTWFTFPDDDTVDLAIVPVALTESKVDFMTVPSNMLATPETLRELRANENDELLFTGLFNWHPGAKKNYPIVRHGKIALLPEERIPLDRRLPDTTVDVYLAEITSFGGNSGSPVFLRIGGFREGPSGVEGGGYNYYLLGVMKGFFPEASEVAIEVEIRKGVAAQNSGIAAVVPAHYILKIFEGAPAKSLREKLVDINLKRGDQKPN